MLELGNSDSIISNFDSIIPPQPIIMYMSQRSRGQLTRFIGLRLVNITGTLS